MRRTPLFFFPWQLRRILIPWLIITKKVNTGTCCAQVAARARRQKVKLVFFYVSNSFFSCSAACKPPKVCHHRSWQMNKITSTPLDYYYYQPVISRMFVGRIKLQDSSLHKISLRVAFFSSFMRIADKGWLVRFVFNEKSGAPSPEIRMGNIF